MNIVLDDDDDDVIVLPTEEPVITEIHDEDADRPECSTPTATAASNAETSLGDATAFSTPGPASQLPAPVMNYESIGNESDLQILVPQISVLDLDEIEERTAEERAAVDEAAALQMPVKIKEEPRNKGYRDELDDAEEEDDGFEEVGTIESAAIDDDSGEYLFTCIAVWLRVGCGVCACVCAVRKQTNGGTEGIIAYVQPHTVCFM